MEGPTMKLDRQSLDFMEGFEAGRICFEMQVRPTTFTRTIGLGNEANALEMARATGRSIEVTKLPDFQIRIDVGGQGTAPAPEDPNADLEG